MLALGIDIGTSGVRTAVLDETGRLVSRASVEMPAPELLDGRSAQDPMIWWNAVVGCLEKQIELLRAARLDPKSIVGVAVDGTSGTMLMCDAELRPCTPGLMYNSAGFTEQARRIEEVAPPESHARGAGSGLARAMFLLTLPGSHQAMHLLHQADWIAARLAGRGGFSDQNNVLKTGFDLTRNEWPEWMANLGVAEGLLPEVHAPGEVVAHINAEIASRFGLSTECRIHAGTTDSIAAFLATGASKPGDAVTSLGTTLVIKLVSNVDVRDPAAGVYSHRLGDRWLPGGASNTGGGALLRHFSLEQMAAMTPLVRSDRLLDYGYYPLPGTGERFPVCDPEMESIHSPRPVEDHLFFQGLLEGIARIEKQAYDHLAKLGAAYPSRVFTVGGGASNKPWCEIRQEILGVPVIACNETIAAAGTARLVPGSYPNSRLPSPHAGDKGWG